MMKDMTVTQFAELTASKSAVPGGGSISALCGSLAAALAEMVANLTIGNRKYIQHSEEMIDIAQKASLLRNGLLGDIEKDSAAFSAVMDAYKMPKETDEEKKDRRREIQSTLKEAVRIPMEAAGKSLLVMELAEAVVRNGNRNAVTDGLVSAMMARTAVLGALLNAKINLSSIKDSGFTDEMNKKIADYEEKARIREESILNSVEL